MTPAGAEAPLARRLDRIEQRLELLEAALGSALGERVLEALRLDQLRQTAKLTDQAEAEGHPVPRGRHNGGY